MTELTDAAILRIAAPDRKGIVHAVTRFLDQQGGNILELEQFVDQEVDTFFMRVVWDMAGFSAPLARFDDLFAPVAEPLRMTWQVSSTTERSRLALFVSKEPHCLAEALLQWRLGGLPVDIPLVIGNQPHARDLAEKFGVPFFHIPFEEGRQEEVEIRQKELLKEYRIDFVGLARYMRILSPAFVGEWTDRIINIHHSFLPAFAGADPYGQAYRRGVKIIGATAHFVTAELDAGPIIAQEVRPVDHSHSVPMLREIGRETERSVFFTALRKFAERKIVRYGNRTVIFR
ncbi:MAG: formyltetrahydrofolate deformylase [Nitrospinae bacterium]|nr:formyltetrahydrofolate deformylase [Nitrospinota bacterium]